MYTVRLERKVVLSAAAECYHFEFVFTEGAPAVVEPGQFLSFLADDASGKTYTRAYSLASAPRAGAFDLCVNRVAGGFFSNLLCEMREGETILCHGPHGLFTLKPAEGLLVAAGTGIAPMRGFVQWLFAEDGVNRSEGREYWLVYEGPEPGELFYDGYFRGLAERHVNFHYLPVAGREGEHAEMERVLAGIAPGGVGGSGAAVEFGRYAYVCGLSEVVKAARARLVGLGWQKRQVLFERYD